MKADQRRWPTEIHERAAEAIVEFSSRLPVQACLLVNSCARGTATTESDLDIALLIAPEVRADERRSLEAAWAQYYAEGTIFRELEQLSRFARVHLDFFDGQWTPEIWDDGGGPDAFEIEIGNRVAYSAPLGTSSDAFADLRELWLPYYGAALREQRLRMVSVACRLDLDRVRFAAKRRLEFYAFDRLYHAFQEFLQALFIARGIYPIAYNKWIREQVVDLLGLESLYPELSRLPALGRLEKDELTSRADQVDGLLDLWATPAR